MPALPLPPVELLDGAGSVCIGLKPSSSERDEDEISIEGVGLVALLVIIGKLFGVSRDLPESDSMVRPAELLDSVP